MFGWWGGPGLDGFVTGMGSLGVPAPLALLAAITEFFGGVALLIGLFSRLAAVGIAVTMAVAMFKVHFANGFLLSNEGGGYEYTLVLLLVSIAVAILGPGRLAIADPEGRLIGNR
jgi:putative oxidoreductase